jgi:formylglycine-generating enzyme required for sulfatase activity
MSIMPMSLRRALCGLAFVVLLAAPALAQAPLSSFKDCADCPEMVVMPAGRFIMGTPPEPFIAPPSRMFDHNPVGVTRFPDQFTRYAPNEEQPVREVTIKAFAIGKFELTQAEWMAVMGDNPSPTKGDRLPVVDMSWDDAQKFIARLNAKTGKTYRLPTEAEWEYAARGGTQTAFSFGDDAAELSRYAWWGKNADFIIHEVGTRDANPFGLHDVHGNVWEWVQDCYRASYAGAPTDGTAVDAPSCARSIRGGMWGFDHEFLRSAARARYNQIESGGVLGLRLARSLP